MHKAKAIELLGGSVKAAADSIGVTYQAVEKWPDVLPARIADRVIAAIARKHPEVRALIDVAASSEPSVEAA